MKNYNFTLFTCILLAIILSAQNLNGQSNITIVSGKITNQSNETAKVITINACEPLADNDRFASRIDSSGIFRTSFEMLWSHSFTISYDRQFINLYADPGDSIYIEIDATKFHEQNRNAVVFGGNNSRKNAEFHRAFDDLNGIIKLSCSDFSLPLSGFMKSFMADNKRINDSIAVYCRVQNMSQWTEKLMQDMSLYGLANYAMDYKGRDNSEMLEFFTQPVFDIYSPAKFSNMMFSYHVEAFLNAIFKNDSLITAFAKGNDLINLEKRGNELIMALPRSLTRDFMLFKFYKKLEKAPAEFGAEIFSNKAVYKILLALSSPPKQIELPEIESDKGVLFWSPDNKIEKIRNFKFDDLIKKNYKDKVIYLDIWATWCGPCREQMAPARELHKLFHDKDVVFLNICMKSDLDKWTKMVRNGECEGVNYFFDDDLSSETAAGLLSEGFPTYILIDKNGKIRTKDAPRPTSVSQACDAIDKLLAE